MPSPRLRSTASPALLVSLAVLTGCGIRPLASDGTGTASKGTVITAERIQASGAATAWDALHAFSGSLRLDEDQFGNPTRASHRGRSSILLSNQPVFYMDGVKMADFRVLQEIPAVNLARIQFLTGPEATTYYGTNSGHGVIVFTTRLPDDAEPEEDAPPEGGDGGPK